MLFSSKKEERQKEDGAETLNAMKTWCKTNGLLLQAFAMESGAARGSESRTSEWEWEQETRSKYTADGQKNSGRSSAGNFKLFIYQEGEHQRKKIIFMKEYHYNNIWWILLINKLWPSAKWFVAEKDYYPVTISRSRN